MGEKGEGSGGERGGKWGERGRELGMGYPLSTPSYDGISEKLFYGKMLIVNLSLCLNMCFGCSKELTQ